MSSDTVGKVRARAMVDMNTDEGSWWPFGLIFLAFFMRWLCYSPGNLPVKIRRWYNIQRLQLRKQFGYRDDSIYGRGTAGDGSNTRSKRQG